jgi:ubiquinone/menaquinone biosynthesis C-methylase UbiE
MNENKVREYWDLQAEKFSDSSLATSPDTIAYNMEIEEIKAFIFDGCKILDIGCGNGIKGIELTKNKDVDYIGVDYSESMIRCAQGLAKKEENKLLGRVRYLVGNVLDFDSFPEGEFDIIITDRCLINLENIENQTKAVENIEKKLKKGGRYLMLENSIQALNNLNEVRKKFNLTAIPVRWHNFYIDENQFIPILKRRYQVEEIRNFASTYYLISRTLNSILTPEDCEVDYNSEINMLASKLPALGDYSPLKLFVLLKM